MSKFKKGDWVKTSEGWVGRIASVEYDSFAKLNPKYWNPKTPIRVTGVNNARLPMGYGAPYGPVCHPGYFFFNEKDLTPYKLNLGDRVKYKALLWDSETQTESTCYLRAFVKSIKSEYFPYKDSGSIHTTISIGFPPINYGPSFKECDTLELNESEAYQHLEKEGDNV